MGIILTNPVGPETSLEEKEDDGWTVLTATDEQKTKSLSETASLGFDEETTVRWLQKHAFIPLSTTPHHQIPPEVLRESILQWKEEGEQFIPQPGQVSDDEDTPVDSVAQSEATRVEPDEQEGWKSVVMSWGPKPAHLNFLESELKTIKEQYIEISVRLEQQQALTLQLKEELQSLRQQNTPVKPSTVPPPFLGELKSGPAVLKKVPSPVKEEEQLMTNLVSQIDQSDLPAHLKPTATERYLKKFSKNPKGLEKLLCLHPYLVSELPMLPKKAYERMSLWENELFAKVDADTVQKLRIQKRHAVMSLSSEEDIMADIKLTQLVLAKRKVDSAVQEKRMAAAKTMESVLSELQSELSKRQKTLHTSVLHN